MATLVADININLRQRVFLITKRNLALLLIQIISTLKLGTATPHYPFLQKLVPDFPGKAVAVTNSSCLPSDIG